MYSSYFKNLDVEVDCMLLIWCFNFLQMLYKSLQPVLFNTSLWFWTGFSAGSRSRQVLSVPISNLTFFVFTPWSYCICWHWKGVNNLYIYHGATLCVYSEIDNKGNTRFYTCFSACWRNTWLFASLCESGGHKDFIVCSAGINQYATSHFQLHEWSSVFILEVSPQ